MDRSKPNQTAGRVITRRRLHAGEDLSVVPLRAIVPLLQELGADPAAVLQRVGMSPDALGDSANRLPFGAAGALVDECARATGCPHFGLLLGIRSGPAAAGLSSELMRHAQTVRDGLQLLIDFQHLHDRGGVVALTPHGADDVELSYVIYHPDTPGTSQVLDASIAISCSIMRSLCGPRWSPAEVMLSRARPPSVSPYRAFYRAPIRFDAPRSAVIFPAWHLDLPIAGTDPDERRRLAALAAELDSARPASVTELTLRTLGRMIVALPPSGDKVAEVLGIKRRRLRERLAAEGTSIKALLEDLRCELARQLLEGSRMPIGEIASTLHYSKPGAFSRAFKAWTGKTPRQWRASTSRGGRSVKAAAGSA
jgi:AraC-like DNA-binding protein